MIKGSYVALVTPFKNNEVDYNALENLLEFQIENQTDGILFCGTTGESPALAGDEKEQLVRFGIHKINKRVPVMMGTGTNNLQHTISNTIKAKDWGVDSALVITPYYNKPTQQGLYNFFKSVAENTDIPIVLYNVPGRTGVNMQAETTLKLAHEFKNIVGIKEASGDLVQLSAIAAGRPDGFSIMCGEDALNLPAISCGANGTVSVTANIIPQLVHNLVSFANNGEYKKALEIHQNILELNSIMFIETNPIPAKETLHLMGKIEREFRSPMCTLKPENLLTLKAMLQKHKLI